MTCVVGTDEAGYGPNLGPLVISATVWQVPATRPIESLPAHLASIRHRRRRRGGPRSSATRNGSTRAGGGLAALERGVSGGVGVDRRTTTPPCERGAPCSNGSIRTALAALADMPWYAAYDCSSAGRRGGRRDRRRLVIDVRRPWRRPTSSLTGLRSRVVFPAEFNARVAACGSKGTALSLWTLELVRDLIEPRATRQRS